MYGYTVFLLGVLVVVIVSVVVVNVKTVYVAVLWPLYAHARLKGPSDFKRERNEVKDETPF